MFVRCAYFEGNVATENRERFAALVREGIAPNMRRFPEIRRLECRWGYEFEADDRGIYLTIEHSYDSPEDIAAAITSDVRSAMQPAIDEAMSLFQGRVYHVNYEVDSAAVD